MRALRFLALAAALVAPAAARAQISVYVGPSPRCFAPVYHHQGWAPARLGYGPGSGYAMPVQPGWNGWRAHRYWAEHRGYSGHGFDRRW